VGPDHRKGKSNASNNGVAVEVLEVLPRRLAPFDDDVRARWPAVGLRSRLQVDVVEHWFDSSNYGIKFVPLGSGVLLEHIELRFDPPTVVCKHYKVPSRKETTSALTPTREYLPFNSSASLSAHPVSFAFSSRSCSRSWRSWMSSLF